MLPLMALDNHTVYQNSGKKWVLQTSMSVFLCFLGDVTVNPAGKLLAMGLNFGIVGVEFSRSAV